ncbi:MAG: RDD family protein [Candidatus Acidiferrum sp.]
MSSHERAPVLSRHDVGINAAPGESRPEHDAIRLAIESEATELSAAEMAESDPSSTWRGELANRVQAYRVRRRKVAPDAMQSRLPFAEPFRAVKPAPASRISTSAMSSTNAYATTVAIEDHPVTLGGLDTASGPIAVDETEAVENDFSFTIAIGRIAKERPADGRVMIDVSAVQGEEAAQEPRRELTERAHAGLYPVAPMGDRRIAAIIDVACLLFACGGFLALFGSLGGHFTLSKLSAAVCLTALAVVYFQYFALFTIFGGTTPGMMLRNLQVMSFTGDEPTPKQMLLRSAGYMLSAAPCLMGFLWAVWDEDGLTWHDRFSKTYLSSAQTYAEIESHTAVHPH